MQDEAQLIGRDGGRSEARAARPSPSATTASSRGAAGLSPFTFDAGGFPRGPRDIAIDAGTADDEGYTVGDTIGVSARGPVAPVPHHRHRRASGMSSRSATPPPSIFTLRDRAVALQASRAKSTRSSSTARAAPDPGGAGQGDRAGPAARSRRGQDRRRSRTGSTSAGSKDFLKILQGGPHRLRRHRSCSSGPSSSSTRCPSPSPSGRSEFAPGPHGGRQPAARSCGSVILEAFVIGVIASVVGLARRPGPGHGLNASSRRSAPTCPTAGRCSRPARSSSPSSSASA